MIVSHKEGTATIVVWNCYAHTQPTGPTIGYVTPWWRTSVCESYFNQEWQGVIDAAEAAAAREAQIAIQLHEDAAEARRLQDVFDLLGLGWSDLHFGDLSPTFGPFDLLSEPLSPTADVWGPQYPKACWRLPATFSYGSG